MVRQKLFESANSYFISTLFNNLNLYLVTASSSAESGVDMMTMAAPARFNSKTASSKV